MGGDALGLLAGWLDSVVECGHNDYMRTVGSRELKARLGTYLRRVREGETLVITSRGEPIAKLQTIVEPGDTQVEARIKRLIARGALSRGAEREPVSFEPLELPSGLSTAILEDREDRI